MKKTIVDHGGCVKETVPYRTKSVSTKKYIVVSSKKAVEKKPAAVIQHAIRRGFPVVNSQFIFGTIEGRQRVCPTKYELELQRLKSTITRDVSIGRKHFTRSKGMNKLLTCKQKRSKCRPSKLQVYKPPKYFNPSVFFVAQKLRSYEHKVCQKERRKLFRQYLFDWRAMSSQEKRKVSDAWKRWKESQINRI